MNIQFKLTAAMADRVRRDLRRPHAFAAERVGFITCRFGLSQSGRLLILAYEYYPAADADYVDDSRYGALLGANGFRKILQVALSNEVGIFHVHLHDHPGKPRFSGIDLREMAQYVPDFFNVRPGLPHGGLVFSATSMNGSCWLSKRSKGTPISEWVVVGRPLINKSEGPQ